MQYTVMTMLALGIATLPDRPPALAAGLIPVGSVPDSTSGQTGNTSTRDVEPDAPLS